MHEGFWSPSKRNPSVISSPCATSQRRQGAFGIILHDLEAFLAKNHRKTCPLRQKLVESPNGAAIGRSLSVSWAGKPERKGNR
jgi:hypothetical protein